MERLWAPWRIKYIKAETKKNCIFCEGKKIKDKKYVVFKTKHSFVMLNIFPYNNGHLMVAPKRHIKDLSYLKESEILDLVKTLNTAKSMLDKVLKPQGYNIGINISKTAGAGIAGHLHIHLVPRWQGDTNFMPVLYNTKIVSQSLDELYKLLRHVKSKTD